MPFFPPGMYGPAPEAPRPHQRATPKPAEIIFGEDWRRDHRLLADEQRAAALAYISAIADRSCRKPEAELHLATRLWVRFRDRYDSVSPGLSLDAAFRIAMHDL